MIPAINNQSRPILTSPAVPLPPIQEKKLDLREIFSRMGTFVCQVSSLRGKCSGIFLGMNQVLVPFHAIALQKIGDLPEGRVNYHIFSIEISYQDTTYTAKYSGLHSLDAARYYDCCLFVVIDDDFTPIVMPEHSFEPPVLGDKIYFAGYPLGQKTPSFHKGVVSSVDEADNMVCFNIDAVVLPGNSGGPVFIKRDGKLLMIGVIFAELAQIDSQFIRERQAISERLTDEGAKLSLNGVNVGKAVSNMIDTVFDNLATGIGKVMGLRHVRELTSRTDLPKDPSPFNIGFPVIKTEKLPGMLGKDPIYLEWFHRTVKPNKAFCASIVGKAYDAADQIDKDDEIVLREYYETNVLNNPQKGHDGFERSTEDNYKMLKNKILEAKPKALRKPGRFN